VNPQVQEATTNIIIYVLILAALVIFLGTYFIVSMLNKHTSIKFLKTGLYDPKNKKMENVAAAFCQNCGFPVGVSDYYCAKCGKKL
jgi:hypothetical protein